jgi:hypothetical protein
MEGGDEAAFRNGAMRMQPASSLVTSSPQLTQGTAMKKSLGFGSILALAIVAAGIVAAPVTFDAGNGSLAVKAAHAKDLVDVDVGDDGD